MKHTSLAAGVRGVSRTMGDTVISLAAVDIIALINLGLAMVGLESSAWFMAAMALCVLAHATIGLVGLIITTRKANRVIYVAQQVQDLRK